MRIHSDVLNRGHIILAARRAGNNVHVRELTEHGSKSRAKAFNFYLVGNSPFRPGFGRSYDDDAHAASWDEWGIAFGYLFERDPNMHCGKHSYQSAEHFHWVTCNRFYNLTPAYQHVRHKWSLGMPDPTHTWSMAYCEGCEAAHRWTISGKTWEQLRDAV